MKLLAQAAPHEMGRIGEDPAGLGPFASVGSAEGGLAGISSIVSSIIGLITIAAGIWFIFQFMIGGFSFITSGGDKGKLQTAQSRLTNSFIGLVVVVAGWSILALASQFFNVDFTLSGGNIINSLTPN